MPKQNIAPYFIDQYGYIYRWQESEFGFKSVLVGNWQNDKGSAKEASAMVDLANEAVAAKLGVTA